MGNNRLERELDVQHLAWPKELAMTTPPDHPIGSRDRTAAGSTFYAIIFRNSSDLICARVTARGYMFNLHSRDCSSRHMCNVLSRFESCHHCIVYVTIVTIESLGTIAFLAPGTTKYTGLKYTSKL
jgi:hypothetical protein